MVLFFVYKYIIFSGNYYNTGVFGTNFFGGNVKQFSYNKQIPYLINLNSIRSHMLIFARS